MKIKLRPTAILILIVCSLISGCTPANPAADPGLTRIAGDTALPLTADPAAPASSSTIPPIATVYPPVFDPAALGDNRMLDSFVLTRTDLTTGGGERDEHAYEIGYVREPFSGYQVHRFNVVGEEYFQHRKYSINGRFFMTNASYDWLISQETSPEEVEYLQEEADLRQVYDTDFGPLSARFDGQEDYQGIPANHFTFDQTNLRGGSDPTGTYKIESAEGDLYLSQTGGYLLYFHIKMTGNLYFGAGPEYSPGVREYTEELTSINALSEIAVPVEYLEPEQTLQELGLPLPPGTTLTGMERFTSGLGIETYYFASPVTGGGFYDFYANLGPADGWTVTHIGIVQNHYRCGQRDCIILRNGDAQVILNYTDGGFFADYDRQRIYAPAPN